MENREFMTSLEFMSLLFAGILNEAKPETQERFKKDKADVKQSIRACEENLRIAAALMALQEILEEPTKKN